MVVADEEAGCGGVVECIADGMGEGVGDIDAAIGHEVVDVIDNDE